MAYVFTHTEMHTHTDSNLKAGQENGVKSSFKGSDGGLSELGQHVHGACVSLEAMKGRHRKHLLIFTWATLRSAGPTAAELRDPPKIVTNQTTHRIALTHHPMITISFTRSSSYF